MELAAKNKIMLQLMKILDVQSPTRRQQEETIKREIRTVTVPSRFCTILGTLDSTLYPFQTESRYFKVERI
jgi:hypothetical protein